MSDEIPEVYARYIRATFPPEVLRDAPNEITGRWKHLTGPREREFWRSLEAAREPRPVPDDALFWEWLDAYVDEPHQNTYEVPDLQRAFEAGIAAQPQPAPGLRADSETADLLRADLAAAEAEIAKWPRCPAGCRCRVGTDDADALECGCDGPCTTGREPQPAADLAAVRKMLASIDPDKLDILADWFDRDDAVRGRLGIPEVQTDLRRWAETVRNLSAGLTDGN